MNFNPAASRSFRFADDNIPASAAMTISTPSILCRVWNCRTIGTIVRVSAWFPSKHPISNGKPVRSHE